MSTYAEIDRVIHFLERIEDCPDDYLIEGAPPVISFLTGFYTALIAGDQLPTAQYAECSRRVVEEAGYRDATRPLWVLAGWAFGGILLTTVGHYRDRASVPEAAAARDAAPRLGAVASA